LMQSLQWVEGAANVEIEIVTLAGLVAEQ